MGWNLIYKLMIISHKKNILFEQNNASIGTLYSVHSPLYTPKHWNVPLPEFGRDAGELDQGDRAEFSHNPWFIQLPL